MTTAPRSGKSTGPIPCVCGCGLPPVHWHHALRAQTLRRAGAPDVNDPRGLVPICLHGHAMHHSRGRKLPLSVLPDSVFELALEVLGAGPGYEELARAYGGSDPRLDALLEAWEEAA